MEKNWDVIRYEAAAAILPNRLRKLALALPEEQKAAAEEFRLRAGRPMTVLLPEGELPLEAEVDPAELETLCDLATEFSRYAAAETLREGFVPVRGGFRLGLCGTAVMKGGMNTNLKNLSSAAIRIARERKGVGTDLAPRLFRDGVFRSTLILSPPGGGKTTLLRDLVRCVSEGVGGTPALRVSLVDERGEVAVMYRGQPQMDVGSRTDVLDACPKALGIPIVLRAMSLAAGCGVGLLATIHAADTAELLQRPLYRDLLAEGVFQQAVCIATSEGKRTYRMEELPC